MRHVTYKHREFHLWQTRQNKYFISSLPTKLYPHRDCSSQLPTGLELETVQCQLTDQLLINWLTPWLCVLVSNISSACHSVNHSNNKVYHKNFPVLHHPNLSWHCIPGVNLWYPVHSQFQNNNTILIYNVTCTHFWPLMQTYP